MITSPAAAAEYPHLLSPFRLGTVELRNRFVFQPHFTALMGDDSMPNAILHDYFVERARGGAGLIVDGHMTVMVEGMMAPHYIKAWEEGWIPAYRAIVDDVHAHGREDLRTGHPRRAYLAHGAAADPLGADPDARAVEPPHDPRDGPRRHRTGRPWLRRCGAQHHRHRRRWHRGQDRPRRAAAELRVPVLQSTHGRVRRLVREADAAAARMPGLHPRRGRYGRARRDPAVPQRVHPVRLRPRVRPPDGRRLRVERPGRLLQQRRGHVLIVLDGDPAGGRGAGILPAPEPRAQGSEQPPDRRLRAHQAAGDGRTDPRARRGRPDRAWHER